MPRCSEADTLAAIRQRWPEQDGIIIARRWVTGTYFHHPAAGRGHIAIGQRGDPDLMGWRYHKGSHAIPWVIECKSRTTRLDRHQRSVRDALLRIGVAYCVSRDPDHALDFLERLEPGWLGDRHT